MNLVLTPPVEIALRTLDPDERRAVAAWIDRLKNWTSDSRIRGRSRKLGSGVYVLRASNDFRVFFRLHGDEVEVLDIAKKATIMSFGNRNGRGRR